VSAAPVARTRRREIEQHSPASRQQELQAPSQASLATVGGGLEDLTLSQNSGLAEGISFRSN
jgi:hypothetical protein